MKLIKIIFKNQSVLSDQMTNTVSRKLSVFFNIKAGDTYSNHCYDSTNNREVKYFIRYNKQLNKITLIGSVCF
jgi:hypothetical protein